MAEVSRREASVQLSESIPWLSMLAYGALDLEFTPYSKSSPKPDDVPVLLACFPSMLSIVEYLQVVSAETRTSSAE